MESSKEVRTAEGKLLFKVVDDNFIHLRIRREDFWVDLAKFEVSQTPPRPKNQGDLTNAPEG